jgi:styrene-oxide isomerase
MQTGRLQALMIAHGGLVLLLGMLCGLPFAFHLLGRIELWPIPWAADLTLPGTERSWRAAHVGNILNGTMLLAAASVVHRLTLAPGLRRLLAACLIVTVWGNAAFYVAACFTTGRGLTFGANRFGGGDWFNSVGYLTAMVAVFAVILALVLVVRGALATARAATAD